MKARRSDGGVSMKTPRFNWILSHPQRFHCHKLYQFFLTHLKSLFLSHHPHRKRCKQQISEENDSWIQLKRSPSNYQHIVCHKIVDSSDSIHLIEMIFTIHNYFINNFWTDWFHSLRTISLTFSFDIFIKMNISFSLPIQFIFLNGGMKWSKLNKKMKWRRLISEKLKNFPW